jgi:hypothetical protein
MNSWDPAVNIFVRGKDNLVHDEQTGSKKFFVTFQTRTPAQAAVPAPSEAAVPAPAAEPPPAAEQMPETEPPPGWQWLNTSNVGLFASAFIDSISSLLAPPPPTASRSSSRIPPPPSARQSAAAAAVDRLAAAVAEKVAALSLAEANTTAAEEQSLPSLTERTPHCIRHVNVEPSARIPGRGKLIASISIRRAKRGASRLST